MQYRKKRIHPHRTISGDINNFALVERGTVEFDECQKRCL